MYTIEFCLCRGVVNNFEVAQEYRKPYLSLRWERSDGQMLVGGSGGRSNAILKHIFGLLSEENILKRTGFEGMYE